MPIYVLHLPRQTATLNQLLAGRWQSAKLKKADKELIGLACLEVDMVPATGKRRVSIHVILGPHQRGGDPDCWHKSLSDALVHAGALKDDNRQGCEHGPVTYERGPKRGMRITLEDIP
jgi:hypothetical protein